MATERAERYQTSELNLPRLQRYARRIAAESPPRKQERKARTEHQDVVVATLRRAGFLGLRTETINTTERRAIEVEALPPHWLLLRTIHWIEDTSKTNYEYNEQNDWVLTEAGDLLFVWTWEEYKSMPHDSRGRLESDIQVSTMSAEKILEMDHEHPSYDARHSNRHFWGNRDPGKISVHAPGVGLSLALKKLAASD